MKRGMQPRVRRVEGSGRSNVEPRESQVVADTPASRVRAHARARIFLIDADGDDYEHEREHGMRMLT